METYDTTLYVSGTNEKESNIKFYGKVSLTLGSYIFLIFDDTSYITEHWFVVYNIINIYIEMHETKREKRKQKTEILIKTKLKKCWWDVYI